MENTPAGRARAAVRAARSGLLPGARGPLLHHAAGRPGRRCDQGGEPGRRRHPPLGAAEPGRAWPPTTWRSTGTSVPWSWTWATTAGNGRGTGTGPPCGHHGAELQARRPGPLRPGLRGGQAGTRRIVYASISGFGAGAGAALPGYDMIVQAVSGLMSLTGDAGRAAAAGGHRAVRHHGRAARGGGHPGRAGSPGATGEGQHIEINLLSSALSGMVNQASAYAAGGVVPLRMGNSHPSLSPYEPLPTADGDLVVAAGNDAPVPQAVRSAGRAGAGQRPAFCRE